MKKSELVSLVQTYASLPRSQLLERLETEVTHRPRCPVLRYLLGCQYFDYGQPARGVRHLMVAYHVHPAFESAAFLVFAGLNWLARPSAPLLAVAVDTWEEFRQPPFDRHPDERLLLDAFAEPPPGENPGCVLAGRLWRLPISKLRSELRAAWVSREVPRQLLLTVPT